MFPVLPSPPPSSYQRGSDALPQLQSQALRVLRWVLPDVRALVALQAGEVDDEARSQGVAAAGQ